MAKTNTGSGVNEPVREPIWEQNGFLGEEKSDFELSKRNYPEISSLYLNQAYLTVQKGEDKVYSDHVILGQISAAANSPDDMKTYECAENEVKLVAPFYNEQTGEVLGLRKSLGFINLRGDEEDAFFNYGFSKNKSKVLYAAQKMVTPKVFSGTVFKRHRNEMLKEKR